MHLNFRHKDALRIERGGLFATLTSKSTSSFTAVPLLRDLLFQKALLSGELHFETPS